MTGWSNLIFSLIPFAVLVTVITLFVLPTFLRRFIAGIREKAIYRKERAPARDRPLPRFALPYVVIIWCLLPIVGIIFAPLWGSFFAEQGDQLKSTLFGIEKLPVVLVGIAVVIIHLRPNHSRDLKYTLLIGALPAGALFIYSPFVLGGSTLVSNENLIRFWLLVL
jgi:H+/gluconate symporter-like permease